MTPMVSGDPAVVSGAAGVEERPRTLPPRTPVLTGIEAVSRAGGIACGLIAALHWSSLPNSIPIHFGLSGQPDAWGPRAWLIVIAILPTLMNFALQALGRHPWILQYPVRITRENAITQYSLVMKFLSCLAASIAWFSAWAVWCSVKVALGEAQSLGVWALPVFLAWMAALTVAYFAMARSRRGGVPD